MKLDNLLAGLCTHPRAVACEVTGINHDSRHIQAGELFLAYPGAQSDGRQYIKNAIDAGASAVLYDPHGFALPEALATAVLCIAVPNLSTNLAKIASRFYHHPSQSLSITGVTGTSGKTSVTYQLAQAYALLGKKSAYIGTLGQGHYVTLQALANTTPDALCLQRLLAQYRDNGVRQVCMEVSSHALDQHRVDLVDFDQAIYTNLSHEHLDYHVTMSHYANAKAALFAKHTLQSSIINQDDAYANVMLQQLAPSCQRITYGIYSAADVRACRWQTQMTGSQFEIMSPWGDCAVQTQGFGEFNVYNSLAVFASLMAAGLSLDRVVSVLPKLKSAPGRMEIVATKPTVIVDYAHKPEALSKVLSALNQLKQGRLIVVFGCGGDRDKSKRPMMGKIASDLADFVLVTSDNPRTESPEQIMTEILQGISNRAHVEAVVLRREAIARALSLADAKDIILIAGKGHESYQLIGEQSQYFSDQAVVQDLLAETAKNS